MGEDRRVMSHLPELEFITPELTSARSVSGRDRELALLEEALAEVRAAPAPNRLNPRIYALSRRWAVEAGIVGC